MSRNPPILFASKLNIYSSLSIGISKLPHISSRRHVLNELDIAFVAASPVEDPGTNVTKELMAVWREKQALDALRDCVCETNDDARCLVLMAGKYGPFFMVNKFVINPPFLSREI